MSKQVKIDVLGKQWDDYVAACGNLFGPPVPAVAAGVSALPHSQTDIILAAKVMLFCAPRVKDDVDIAAIIRQWLRYFPCFLGDEKKVEAINSHWYKITEGDEILQPARDELDEFFKGVKTARQDLSNEISLFLDRAAIIPLDDPLGLHKACILLGVEYFSSTPPLRKTLMKVLFPSFT